MELCIFGKVYLVVKKYLKIVDYYIFIYIMCNKYFIILILGYDVILVFFYF